MNLNLTEEQISELKIQFEKWQEIQARKKELQEENKAVCADAARIFEGKATEAGKIFKNMNQLYEGEEAEADNISLMLERIRGNI